MRHGQWQDPEPIRLGRVIISRPDPATPDPADIARFLEIWDILSGGFGAPGTPHVRVETWLRSLADRR